MADSFKSVKNCGKMYWTVYFYHIWNIFKVLTDIYSQICIFLYIFSHITTHSVYFSTFSIAFSQILIFLFH